MTYAPGDRVWLPREGEFAEVLAQRGHFDTPLGRRWPVYLVRLRDGREWLVTANVVEPAGPSRRPRLRLVVDNGAEAPHA